MKIHSHQFIFQHPPSKPEVVSEKVEKGKSPKEIVLENIKIIGNKLKLANEDTAISNQQILLPESDFFDEKKLSEKLNTAFLDKIFLSENEKAIKDSIGTYVLEKIDLKQLVISSSLFARGLVLKRGEAKLQDVALQIPFGKKKIKIVLYYKNISDPIDPKVEVSLDVADIEKWAKTKN